MLFSSSGKLKNDTRKLEFGQNCFVTFYGSEEFLQIDSHFKYS